MKLILTLISRLEPVIVEHVTEMIVLLGEPDSG